MESFSSPPLEIGSVSVDPPLLLAPMSGVTNSCFRRLIKEENPRAVGLVVTEFVSVEGLTRANEKSLRMMRHHTHEHPLAIQIFGSDLSRMVEGAKMAEDAGADIVDINAGCPVPKVVKRGGGCELMRQPVHLGRMLSAVRRALSIPLTLKIRAGWDEGSRNALEIARIAEESGVSMVTVHGRTRVQSYRGLADWELIAQVAQALTIPVVGSGDVTDGPSAALRLWSGVSGLMVGRAVLSNPWVFSEIDAYLNGCPYELPPPIRTVELLERYLVLLKEEYPERVVLGCMKQVASQVTRRIAGASSWRGALCTAKNLAQFCDRLAQFHEAIEQGGLLSRCRTPDDERHSPRVEACMSSILPTVEQFGPLV